MALLDVQNLGISFGGLKAVDGFHVSIEKGELYGLIGPNGAGKTTVFNMLTGVYKPDNGVITLDGTNITGKKTIDINKEGVARTFQNIRLFKAMSVLDNVKVGLHNHYKYSDRQKSQSAQVSPNSLPQPIACFTHSSRLPPAYSTPFAPAASPHSTSRGLSPTIKDCPASMPSSRQAVKIMPGFGLRQSQSTAYSGTEALIWCGQ